jgi:hypothetical protein
MDLLHRLRSHFLRLVCFAVSFLGRATVRQSAALFSAAGGRHLPGRGFRSPVSLLSCSSWTTAISLLPELVLSERARR